MDRKQEINDFQNNLVDMFSHRDIIGRRYLQPTRQLEADVGQRFVEKYHGHRILTDCFLDFFGETLSAQANFSYRHGWPKEPFYITCLMMYVTMFRGTRAAEILSVNAYPMQGYAAMRSVRDQAWVLWAAASGIATFGELFGWEGVESSEWTPEEQARIVGNRRKFEGFIRSQVIGKRSGLSEDAQIELLRWDRMFNQEAHRALFTLFRASMDIMDPKGSAFSLVPHSDDMLDGMFLNRSTEINWMILRLLPFVRRKETHDDEWVAKWKLLDDSFRFMYRGFEELGKKIAPAFVEMMNMKFAFDETVFFIEPNKRAEEASPDNATHKSR